MITAAKALRKTRAELMKDIDADYYGYRDEDDAVMVPLEQEFEKKSKDIVTKDIRFAVNGFGSDQLVFYILRFMMQID